MATRKTKTSGVSLAELMPLEDSREFSRDIGSKAVINTNKKAYLKAVQDKKNRLESKNELDSIKSDISELRKMLEEVINKLGSPNGNS